MKRITAVAIALVVHALTLAFVVLGAWTIVVNSAFVFAWLIGGGLIGIGWLLRPRLGQVPADAEVLDRPAATELYGIAERVADRMGIARPKKIVVQDLVPATVYQRVGPLRTPVLVIGLPLWLALPPRRRVTLLALAYARGVTGDDVIVASALSTLGEWRGALLGSGPLKAREEAQNKITASLGALDSPGTGYEVAGTFGRMIGRVLGAPVLLLERGLTRLTRSGDGPRRERMLTLARRVVPAEDLAELEEVMASTGYLAPMQAAVLRGESVPAIRQGALARFERAAPSVFGSPTATLLGSAESDRIDDELLQHYTRAVRGFGLIT
ncbi:hypothetical protein [Nonomuraea glycinis]|uniref:hypothetical protein n=1 Tax=Nonomuraea glycinis TaxID=2047744 RepID=UPI0033BE820D